MRRFRRLFPYLGRYRGKLAAGFACVAGSSLVSLFAPWVVGSAIDELSVAVTRSLLARYALLLVAISAVQGLFLYAQRQLVIGVSRQIEYDLRNDFFAHLLTLPPSFFQEHRIGDLMSRATNDLGTVRMVVGPAVMHMASTAFVTAGALVMMLRIDAGLTGVALLSLPLVVAATQHFGGKIHVLFERVQEYFGSIAARAQENFAGARVVRAYAREAAEEAEFAVLNREYVERSRKLIHVSAIFHPLLQMLIGLGFVSVLWYGGRLVMRGGMSVGGFVAFNLYLGRLIWPMIAVGWVINLLQRGAASLKRMEEVFDTVPAIADRPGLLPRVLATGKIEFRGLSFSYDGRPLLRNIDLTIEAGRTVAVIGPTGCGKSTLMDLVPRLIDAPPGTLFIDDVEIHEWRLADLRRGIGYVRQESFLFSNRLAANIAYGADSEDPASVAQAAAIAGLSADVADFPRGFETFVGERGITLSGGQKQRAAIARAVIRDPPILILDDAFSAVDTATEEHILTGLRGVLQRRSALLVSHRISTVKDADLIVVLEEGAIAERGTHRELLERDGLYADLYRKQLLEEALAAS